MTEDIREQIKWIGEAAQFYGGGEGVADAMERLRFERDEALELRDHYSGLVESLQQELDHFKSVLHKLLSADPFYSDHMTACDKTMGASHPCTCGADSARQLFHGSEPDEEISDAPPK
jgi:hypothetical protein